MDKFCTDYENLILPSDFNVETKEKHMPEFMRMYNLINLIKHKTCFKTPENPSCRDLVLTNCPQSFQRSVVFETGISDFHKLTLRSLKNTSPNKNPR